MFSFSPFLLPTLAISFGILGVIQGCSDAAARHQKFRVSRTRPSHTPVFRDQEFESLEMEATGPRLYIYTVDKLPYIYTVD